MPAGCEQLLRPEEQSQIGCILITGDKIGRFLVRAVEIFRPSQRLSEEAVSAAAAVSECSHSFVSVRESFFRGSTVSLVHLVCVHKSGRRCA